MPEFFLELPEVGRLPSGGGAMNSAWVGAPLVMPPEVTEDRLVSVEHRELSYNPDSEDLRVGEFRCS